MSIHDLSTQEGRNEYAEAISKPPKKVPAQATKKYLIALPSFKGAKGFCHPTILVSGVNESEAIILAKHLKPNCNIGDIKEVNY